MKIVSCLAQVIDEYESLLLHNSIEQIWFGWLKGTFERKKYMANVFEIS